MSCDCNCCSPFPHGAVSWSAVCNVAFPGHTMYALTFYVKCMHSTDMLKYEYDDILAATVELHCKHV